MPSLKEYRNRIASVKSTRKITSAMKMVAASKLKKAQGAAEAAQPYARGMAEMMARVAAGVTLGPSSPRLLIGTGSEQRHLLVVMTADRGLCGGFNGNVVRLARQTVRSLQAQGREVKIICAGRKARDLLRRDFGSLIVRSFTDLSGKDGVGFTQAAQISDEVLTRFEDGEFDVCTLVSNRFYGVLKQVPEAARLIPFSLPAANDPASGKDSAGIPVVYDFEPDRETILAALLPRNISTQIYRALLDSAAGEQAARMTAMDNATRNAGDMINRLSIQYNRARQAFITRELIEIISGAEAV
ncbi:MAG: F0F1 ATP synthase subunit gamma [Rhodospirillales bacterium]|nr:F0F1 ATP synthase subunit gamma [Rhodospirillales bacterium]